MANSSGITRAEGRAAALRIDNLDTDQLMPKQWLRRIDKAGLAAGLLYDHRFDASGKPRPEFVLNQAPFHGVQTLIGGPNFGCGSSREHAVWGLLQFGIRVVVAPSFGEIFFGNAANNGLVLITLPETFVRDLMDEADSPEGCFPVVDLGSMSITSKRVTTTFALSERHRTMLMEGLDVIGMTLAHVSEIHAFENRHHSASPWLVDVALMATKSNPSQTK